MNKIQSSYKVIEENGQSYICVEGNTNYNLRKIPVSIWSEESIKNWMKIKKEMFERDEQINYIPSNIPQKTLNIYEKFKKQISNILL